MVDENEVFCSLFFCVSWVVISVVLRKHLLLQYTHVDAAFDSGGTLCVRVCFFFWVGRAPQAHGRRSYASFGWKENIISCCTYLR